MPLDVAETTEVELRCPDGPERNGYCHPGKLLAKLRLAGRKPSYVQPDNLIEMQCDECSSRSRRQDGSVKYVLHRYDLAGECVSTLVVKR